MRQTYLMLALIVSVVLTAHFAKQSRASEAEQDALADGPPTIATAEAEVADDSAQPIDTASAD